MQALWDLNEEFRERYAINSDIAARTSAYELAARMQLTAPEVVDFVQYRTPSDPVSPDVLNITGAARLPEPWNGSTRVAIVTSSSDCTVPTGSSVVSSIV